MNEFALIDTFFKSLSCNRPDVIVGIGDDAACLKIPQGAELVVSCDTLVAGVHFLSEWDAYDIAYKAVMVNVSDLAAMGATPCWMTLALTLPESSESWLKRYAQGLDAAMQQFKLALVGGDTTRGPLSMTIGIHGIVAEGKAVKRSEARPGDVIFVSGPLGAAALAVHQQDIENLHSQDKAILMDALMHPKPRVDLIPYLLQYASASIDISDGLASDLHHICEQSHMGACLNFTQVPVHDLVRKYLGEKAVEFALSGGDDYELCFTVPESKQQAFLSAAREAGITCFPVGVIEKSEGLRKLSDNGEIKPLKLSGYSHFE